MRKIIQFLVSTFVLLTLLGACSREQATHEVEGGPLQVDELIENADAARKNEAGSTAPKGVYEEPDRKSLVEEVAASEIYVSPTGEVELLKSPGRASVYPDTVEVVVSEDGILADGYGYSQQCDDHSNCISVIVLHASNKVVWNGKSWSPGYVETRRGGEVIRITG